jgi:hypothetical protein
MRRISTILLLFLALPMTARADDAAKRAKIQQLFTVMRMESTLHQVMDSIEKNIIPMTQQMFGGDVPPAMKQQVTDLQKQMFGLIEQEMGWKTMEPAYTEIYARNFTEGQIDDLIAFYQSPTGTAYLDKVPTLTNESMQAAQAKVTTLQPQIRQMIEDFATRNAEAIRKAKALQKSGS